MHYNIITSKGGIISLHRPHASRKPVLLKLDVQGYEKMVLQGAIKILKHVNYLILETSFIQFYKKQPLFDELHEYLKNLGFEFVAPVDVNVGNDFAIIEMDVLYRKVR